MNTINIFEKQSLRLESHPKLIFLNMEFSKYYKALISLMFLFISFNIVAQNKQPREIRGEKSEEKADQSMYIKVTQGSYILMYNKSNTLMHTYTSFYEKYHSGPLKYSVSNRPLLDSYVKEWIAPHFKNIKSDNEKIVYVEINLFSDIDGNIKEISFSYDANWKFPLNSFESLEKDILSSKVKLVFDKNEYPYKGSEWVEYPLRYGLNKLRQMAAE